MIAARQIAFGGSAKKWENPYITDGLVAMWDGEWNAGGGRHDANATEWVDLVGGITATINGDGNSEWTEISANFDGNTYFEIPANDIARIDTLSTNEFSVECSAQSLGGVDNQGVIGFGTNMARYLWLFHGSASDKANASLNWQSRGSSGIYANRNASLQKRRYSTSVVVKDGKGNAYLDSEMHTHSSNVSIGSVSSNTPNFLGLIHGYSKLVGSIFNIRVYNRALTVEEIAHNYEIDKVRFGL